MNQGKVVVFGIGKLAEYVCYALKHDTDFQVSALCIEKEFMPDVRTRWGFHIEDFALLNERYPTDEYKLFIAVGNNDVREKIYNEAKDRGYSFISYLSSRAVTWDDLVYGDNVLVLEGSIIQPFVSIGNNSFLFGPKIGHHCVIGNNTLLSACYLGGNAKIGDNTFLGLNSTVNQNIEVGQSNIIGVGSNVCSNTGDFEVFTNKGTVKRNLTAQVVKNKYLT